MITLRGIRKYFPGNGVYALEQGDFELHPGEIHALLGENGAGKSTLMHIMAGYIAPTAGQVLVDQRERRFAAPADALIAGIGMVRQHPNLTPGFKVWEDCILGAEPGSRLLLHPRLARNRVRALSERWGFNLSVEHDTGSLTVSQRQKAAVLALLFRNTRYLIFDEPTAVLTPGETEGLFCLFKMLKAEGKGVVLISHKLEETLALVDRVTVLRKGSTVATRPADSLNGEAVRDLMFGLDEPTGTPPDLRSERPDTGPQFREQNPNPVLVNAVFSIRNLSVELPGRPFVRGIDLELFPGRIMGIAGVRDSGLETLEHAVTGFLRSSTGSIFLNGRDLTGKGTRAFRESGGAYLSADRTGNALAVSLPLRDSIIIHQHRYSRKGLLGKLGIMDRRFLDAHISLVMEQAGVSRSPQARGDSFSGGMLQRIILAREFAENAALLVLAEPGWGLDRLGRDRLAGKLRAYVNEGRSVLLFSTDVDELVSVSDEILVLRNGAFSARILLDASRNAASIKDYKERIGQAMVGHEE
ncbi:MAG: ATP-binding cassette domain-containing protein [Treponema sp.]|jgi:simple sugar transport system ATP-binding protein|nr:ATP-binding cassette domain-containing protein [Treponema sp.]